MKNIYLLPLLVLAASCNYFSTQQQKAERLARAYLDTAVKEFDNYKLVKSAPIDTLRDGPDNEPAYQSLTAKIDSSRRVADSLNKAITLAKTQTLIAQINEELHANATTTNSLLQQSLQYMLNYQGKPNGWILEQTYRVKNSADSTFYVHVFKIDEGLSKVVGYQRRER